MHAHLRYSAPHFVKKKKEKKKCVCLPVSMARWQWVGKKQSFINTRGAGNVERPSLVLKIDLRDFCGQHLDHLFADLQLLLELKLHSANFLDILFNVVLGLLVGIQAFLQIGYLLLLVLEVEL